MTQQISTLDARIRKLQEQRRALAERDRKKREMTIQQLARKHRLFDVPTEQLETLFARVAIQLSQEKTDAEA